MCEDIFRKAKVKKIKCGYIGAISTESIDFIKYLANKKIVDKVRNKKSSLSF